MNAPTHYTDLSGADFSVDNLAQDLSVQSRPLTVAERARANRQRRGEGLRPVKAYRPPEAVVHLEALAKFKTFPFPIPSPRP